MPTPKNELKERLALYRQIKISVIGRKSGKTISIPVWFVLEGEKLYLLPVQGSDTQWYKNVLQNPSIRIDARGVEAEFRAVPITDAKMVKSVVENRGKEMRLKGKVALVTGASRGIGFTVAELFAREGAIVYAGSSSNPSGIFPAGVTGVELDVSKEEHWKRVVADIVAAHRRVDVLVNNAGIAVYDAVHDCSTENWRKVLGVNQDGCFFGMREIIPHMKAHKAGSIINVSSIWGTAAVPGAHAYHATKGALVMMSKNAAITYVGDGIRVNSIHPGFIDTPLTQAQDPAINANVIALTPMKRAGTPLEIANGCLFLASDESSFMTGAELVIDGGYLAQ